MKLALLQLVHLQSHRIPRKIMQEVGGQSLLTRGVQKLMNVAQATDCTLVIGCPTTDTELCRYVDDLGIRRVCVLPGDAAADDHASIVRGFKDVIAHDFDWVFCVNAVCRPFLKEETLMQIIGTARNRRRPFICTLYERGILWTGGNEKIYGHDRLPDTKNNPSYLRLAHIGQVHPADLWDEAEQAHALLPQVISLTPAERIDIDTPEDLEFARVYAKGLEAAETRQWDGELQRMERDMDAARAAPDEPTLRRKMFHVLTDMRALIDYARKATPCETKPDGIHPVVPPKDSPPGWAGKVDC